MPAKEADDTEAPGEDVLLDYELAFLAVPEPAVAITGALQLGAKVQDVYPELGAWSPGLAAEAHAYYLGASQEVQARDEGFLPFLRSLCLRRRDYGGSQAQGEYQARYAQQAPGN